MKRLFSLLVILWFAWSCTPQAQNVLARQEEEGLRDYYKAPAASAVSVSKTRFDFTELTAEITAGCTTDYEKIRAIYEWICTNIAYDTSYRIRTVDACLQTHRGVCQAYCELFYYLAQSAGVRVEIISGVARDSKGEVGKNGHSWLFAYTRPEHGILLDPTWGAGSVNGSVFTPSENCWLWFNVDPEWMILSHFPDKAENQLLPEPMSQKEFKGLKPVSELWIEYGLNVHELAEGVRFNSLELPHFYGQGEGAIELVKVPLRATMRVGEFYDFRIRLKQNRGFSLVNSRVRCNQEEWTAEDDGTFSLHFMPRDTGTVVLCLRDVSGSYWNGIISYGVEPPTAEDWRRVEEVDPLSAPEVKGVENLQPDKWEQAGVDGRRLLQLIREQHIRELPVLYSEKGQRLQVVNVPMTKQLHAGTEYTFQFRPRSGVKWAIVNNATWYQEWQVADDGLHSMTVTPEAGPLFLYVQMEGDDSFWSCLEYEVE